MKIKELITEQNNIIDEDDFLELVERECKPYLSQVSGNVSMWRGIRSKQPFIEKDVRKNRRPSDTPPIIQERIDQWFKQKFSIEPRSTGVFITGREQVAYRYGHPYQIFPVGNFKFVWSPIVEDLYRNLGHYISQNTNYNFGDFFMANEVPEGVQEKIEQFLEKAQYTSSNLNHVLSDFQNHEVVVICDRFYGVEKTIIDQTDLEDDLYNLKEKY